MKPKTTMAFLSLATMATTLALIPAPPRDPVGASAPAAAAPTDGRVLNTGSEPQPVTGYMGPNTGPIEAPYFAHEHPELIASILADTRYLASNAERWTQTYLARAAAETDFFKSQNQMLLAYDQMGFVLEADRFQWAITNDLVLIVDERELRPAVPASVTMQGATVRMGTKMKVADRVSGARVAVHVYYACVDSLWDQRTATLNADRRNISRSAIMHWITEHNAKTVAEREQVMRSGQYLRGEMEYDHTTLAAIIPAWGR